MSSYFPGRATPAGSAALARQREGMKQQEAETKKNRELYNSAHSHSSFGSKVRTLNQSRFAPLLFLPHLYSRGARAWLICAPNHWCAKSLRAHLLTFSDFSPNLARVCSHTHICACMFSQPKACPGHGCVWCCSKVERG